MSLGCPLKQMKVLISLSKPFPLRRGGTWGVCCVSAILCGTSHLYTSLSESSVVRTGWDFLGEGGLQSSFCVDERGNGQKIKRVTDQYSFGNWISYWVLNYKFGIYCQVTEFIAFQNHCSNVTVHWNHLCAC